MIDFDLTYLLLFATIYCTIMRYRALSAPLLRRGVGGFYQNVWSFADFLFYYLRKKIIKGFGFFEKEKNMLVKFFMMKRGRYTRPFLHFAILSVFAAGISIGPFLAESYPVFGQNSSVPKVASAATQPETLGSDEVFQTKISDNYRTNVISYTVQNGDTLSTIAQKFGISTDTIRWANNLSDDSITSGDKLQIPPVSGVIHKVRAGETIYSIAKEFGANPQEIADFPTNDFANPETHSLVEGETLIVPDGKMPTASNPVPQPVYVQTPDQENQNGGSIAYNGGFIWPVHGLITTPFSPWHPGIDIAGPIGTPVYAIMGGTIETATCGWNFGYGCEVVVKHTNGYWSRYAHLNGQPLVSVGQIVSGGQQIGYRGTTGNSTGPHTHFEIHLASGQAVNPLNYLP